MDIHLHSKMVGIFAATQIFVFFWAGNNGTSICTNISPCILTIHAGSHRPFVPWMRHGEIETWQSNRKLMDGRGPITLFLADYHQRSPWLKSKLYDFVLQTSKTFKPSKKTFPNVTLLGVKPGDNRSKVTDFH